MPAEDTSTSLSGLDVNKLLRELEVPFSPDHVQWRVTNTTTTRDGAKSYLMPIRALIPIG